MFCLIDGFIAMVGQSLAGAGHVTQVHAWGSRIPEDTLSAIMNTNQNIRNFGGSDTLMLSKINMDTSDARVLAALLKDNTTVTKVSADRVKRTYICCMPSCACCN